GGDLRPRQARGGKTDQTLGTDDGLEVAQDGALDRQVFARRLEHVVAILQIADLEGGRERPHDAVGGLGRELAATQPLVDVTADPRHAGVERLLLDVEQVDLRTGVATERGKKPVSQIGSDGPGADDADDHGSLLVSTSGSAQAPTRAGP